MSASKRPGRAARNFLIGAVAAVALAGGNSVAAAENGAVRVGATDEAVVIQLELSKPEVWSYDPTGGEIAPASGEEAVNPIPGIGITVKIRPGGKAYVVPGTGLGDLPADLEAGEYDLVIQIPQESLPGKPEASGGKGVEIVFTLTVSPEGAVRSGGPKAGGY